MGSLIRFVILIVVWLPLAALNAWALQTLWNWYIPYILDMPSLEFAEAVGIALVVTYLTRPMSHEIMESEKDYWQDFLGRIAGAILKPLYCVGAGWVYLWVWPLG